MSVHSAKAAGFIVVAIILLCAAAVLVSADCTRVGAICKDGSTSEATGSGACSWHGGVAKWRVRPDVTVHVRPSKVLTCSVSSIYLDATVSCGELPYTYFWSPNGETTERITVTTPGTYTLTVKEATGVYASYSVEVTESKEAPTLNIPDVTVSCGEPAILDAIISGGMPPYTYSWRPGGQTTEDIIITDPGTYILTVTGANGCTTLGSVKVREIKPPPTVSAGPDKTLTCSVLSVLLDGTVSGGMPPYTYSWSPGGQTTEDITVSAPGTYTLTATGANGCSASDSVVVKESKTPPTVNAGGDKSISLFGPALLDGTVSGGMPPYTYSWSPGGQTTEDITVSAPGTYTLTATGANGCSTSDSVVVNRNWLILLLIVLLGVCAMTCALVAAVRWRRRRGS